MRSERSVALLRQPPFALYWFSRILSVGATHILTVAIGWQLYALTGRALDLGLVGLVQFATQIVLTLVVGQAADRYDRRAIIALCRVVAGVAAAALAVGSLGGLLTTGRILALVAVVGAARAFEGPTVSALVASLVSRALVQMRTPDAMRGRVSAVHSLFTGTSNQLGEFESGVTAALFGAVPAVLIGGFATLAVAALWTYLFPELLRVGTLER